MEYIGLLGLLGLIGLIGLVDRVDPSSRGGAIRLMGLLGFIGLGGFWFSSLGAFGAFVIGPVFSSQQDTANIVGWCAPRAPTWRCAWRPS